MESSSSPNPSYFFVAVAFAFGFVAARFLLDKFVFRRLAIWLLCKKSRPLNLDANTRAKIVKCIESMWKLTYYAAVEFCVLKINYNEPWFSDPKQYFIGWPNQEFKTPLKLIYMCQCGFYTYSIAALLLWETRRKDFSVMMSHHVITVFLIGFSYMTSFLRMGSVVLALHDASDVFLEAAKICKYSGKELGASTFFGLFAVSWLILRLIYYPFWVIAALSYGGVNFLDLSTAYHTFLYYVFNTLLLMLLVFHVYWWYLICAMIMKQMRNRGRVGEDIREDSDDD
ncbi:ceramide synthase LOH2 [Mercurialis annua]|uniref:ceramide synthase LOH2 n=1 Tax=Mercurialis annua TaxID=3986 RepID=UPI00215EAC2E|nr:ceramide synthase LOH2 [Mercurialis annua]